MSAIIHRLALAAARESGLTEREVFARNKSRLFSWPRFAAMAVAHERGKSFPQIATRFGFKDHTGVMYGCRRAAELAQADPAFAALMGKLRAVIPDIHTDPSCSLSSHKSIHIPATDQATEISPGGLASFQQEGA